MALVSALAAVGGRPGDFKYDAGYSGTLNGIQEVEPGWLLCNGSIVAQATYPRLFAEIGAQYNTTGEGAGNFRLPDYRDRLMLFRGTIKLTGQSGGALGHTHTTPAHDHTMSHVHSMMNHTHSLQGHTHTGSTGGPTTTNTFIAGTSPMGSSTHGHSFTTGGPSLGSTGGPSVADTGGPSVASTGTAAPTTQGADPPYQAAGATLIKY